MKKENDQNSRERIRKEYGKRGERTQKMMTFRVDNEVIDWLQEQPNKGRYINNLIAADKMRKGR